MRFNVWRCIGILSLGVAAFFLTAIYSGYGWDYFLNYFLFRYSMVPLICYVLSLVCTAIFLSVEREKKDVLSHE